MFDTKTGSNIIQWPVEEIEKLRSSKKVFTNVEIKAGSVIPLDVGSATQVHNFYFNVTPIYIF